MELPIAPRPAYIVNTISSSYPSPPITRPSSPLSTAPPSPSTAAVHSPTFEYPPPSSRAPSSTPASRSSSKNPLFKRDLEQKKSKNRENSASSAWTTWFNSLLSSTDKNTNEGTELQERGRRRRSMSQVESANFAEDPRETIDEIRQEMSRTTTRASDVKSQASAVSSGKAGWFTREKVQLAVAFAMIGLVGMNDSATGANLESMQAHYKVSYDEISLVFLANVAGYFTSSISATFLTHHIGVNYTLLVASAAMSAGCIALSFAPPFPVFIIALAFLGFGAGIYDAAITTVVSHFENQALMSCMYAFFGIGASIAPIIIGSFVDQEIPWSRYYFAPLSLSLALAIAGFFSFKGYVEPADEHHDGGGTAAVVVVEGEIIHGRAVMSAQHRMKRALKIKAVWIGFFLIMLAFASSDTLSAWIVSFMVSKRDSPEAASRYQLAGLWAGIAIGRIVLAYALGKRLGEKAYPLVLLSCACAFLAIIWAVRQYIVGGVAAAFVGFFIGPVTPHVLSVVGSRVPPSLKSSVMSLTIGLGLVGSAAGPLLFGLAAGRGALGSLPATLIIMSIVSAGAWITMPKNRRRED